MANWLLCPACLHTSRSTRPPDLFIAGPDCDAIVSEREQHIRQYLGYQQFDQALQERLTRWLEARAAEGSLPVLSKSQITEE